MTHRGLKRLRSFPPSHQTPVEPPPTQPIDFDPFAHFISSPSSASPQRQPPSSSSSSSPPRGAVRTRPVMRRAKSLSPDLRRTRHFLLQHGPASSPTFKLKQWIERMEERYGPRPDLSPEIIEIFPPPGGGASSRSLDSIPEDDREGEAEMLEEEVPRRHAQPVSPPLRSRKDHRVGSRRRAGRRLRTVARAPGKELYTVVEEEEEEEDGGGEEVGLGIGGIEMRNGEGGGA